MLIINTATDTEGTFLGSGQIEEKNTHTSCRHNGQPLGRPAPRIWQNNKLFRAHTAAPRGQPFPASCVDQKRNPRFRRANGSAAPGRHTITVHQLAQLHCPWTSFLADEWKIPTRNFARSPNTQRLTLLALAFFWIQNSATCCRQQTRPRSVVHSRMKWVDGEEEGAFFIASAQVAACYD